MQASNPDFAGGANRVSLNQARKNFLLFGAATEDAKERVRKPMPEEVGN